MVGVCSSADGSSQCHLEELLYFLPWPKSSVYFEIVTKPLLLSRQCHCHVSPKHPHPSSSASVWPPLPASACDGWEPVISFRKIIPLKPYLSCFWTSMTSHSSSSTSLCWFLSCGILCWCELNPRVQKFTHTIPTARQQPVFWTGKSSSSCSPSTHKRTVLNVKVNEKLFFSLMLLKP